MQNESVCLLNNQGKLANLDKEDAQKCLNDYCLHFMEKTIPITPYCM